MQLSAHWRWLCSFIILGSLNLLYLCTRWGTVYLSETLHWWSSRDSDMNNTWHFTVLIETNIHGADSLCCRVRLLFSDVTLFPELSYHSSMRAMLLLEIRRKVINHKCNSCFPWRGMCILKHHWWEISGNNQPVILTPVSFVYSKWNQDSYLIWQWCINT